MILTDLTSSALGSHNGTGVVDPERAYCLWILTVYNNLTDPTPIDPIPSISLTVNNIHTACGVSIVCFLFFFFFFLFFFFAEKG